MRRAGGRESHAGDSAAPRRVGALRPADLDAVGEAPVDRALAGVVAAHRVHYSEITVKGVYHHRPDMFVAEDLISEAQVPIRKP